MTHEKIIDINFRRTYASEPTKYKASVNVCLVLLDRWNEPPFRYTVAFQVRKPGQRKWRNLDAVGIPRDWILLNYPDKVQEAKKELWSKLEPVVRSKTSKL